MERLLIFQLLNVRIVDFLIVRFASTYLHRSNE